MLRFVDLEVTRLPGGEQGPAQGPYTPVKQYPEGYMPEGGEPAPAFAAPIRRAKSNSPRPAQSEPQTA